LLIPYSIVNIRETKEDSTEDDRIQDFDFPNFQRATGEIEEAGETEECDFINFPPH
jgi:hypothetical protein